MLHFPAYWGDWGSTQICPGSQDYVTQFQFKSIGAGGDDSALNGVKLFCKDGGSVTSAVAHLGYWTNLSPVCSTGFTGATVKIEGQVSLGVSHCFTRRLYY